MCLKYFQYVPWGSLFALIISLLGSVMFIILFDGALQGFAEQLSVLVPVGTFSKFRWILIVLTMFLIISVIGFVFVGGAATSVSVRYHMKEDIPDERSFLIRTITSPCILGLLSLVLSILERRARKGEHYAMNQGTVDSNSFILTNMGK
ncbi:hypothetical protein DINM_020487 [Dirofilaria immitis]|nr:hypothetical protein [Dirofilaria immitis]